MKPEDDGMAPANAPPGEAVGPRDKPRHVAAKIRERRKREAAADVTGDTRKLVVFQLGEEYFALDAREVVEIVPIADITWVPGCPDEILGVMNVRGNIESILEPHRLMGLTFRGVTPQSRVIIAAAGGVQSGILVDMVHDVLDVAADFIKKPLATLSSRIRNFAAGGENIWRDEYTTLLDAGRLFDAMLRSFGG